MLPKIPLELFFYAETLALLTSIYCFNWLRKTPYVYFLPYMLMTVTAEILGRNLHQQRYWVLNNRVFNITTIIEFLFFFGLFFTTIKKRFLKKTITILSLVYFTFAIVNICFIQGFNQFNSYSMLVGTITVIAFVFFYFYDVFDSGEPIHLLREPMFWISIGVFLFYLGDFTFNSMYPYLQRNNLKREKYLFGLINHNLIVFEYICFSVALIICSRNRLVSKPQFLP